MAQAEVERRSDSHFDIIDLTLSDDDLTPSGPASPTTPSRVANTSRSNHGLLLDGAFRSSTRHGLRSTSRASWGSLGRSPTGTVRAKQLKEEGQSSWLDRTKSPKRRRVDNRSATIRSGSGSSSLSASAGVSGKQLEHKGTQAATTKVVTSLKKLPLPSHGAPLGAPPANLPGEASKMSRYAETGDVGKTLNERLIVVLRQQVFPHINKCLNNYRRSIENMTRKQLGKKTAHELCDEAFMHDLQRNNGRLSALFEAKLSLRAQVLVDQFAGEVLTRKGEDDNFQPESPVAASATPTSSKSQKMTRLPSGEMSPIPPRTKQMGLKTSSTQNTPIKQLPIEAPTPTSIVTIDSSSSESDNDDDDDDMEDVGRLSPTTSVSAESNDKPSNSGPSTSSASIKRPLRPRIVQKSALSALPKESYSSRQCSQSKPVASPQSTRKRSYSQVPRPKSKPLCDTSAKFLSIIERYKLRLAGLDSSLPRPYLSTQNMRDVEGGIALLNSKDGYQRMLSKREMSTLQSSVCHVDFCEEEIEYLIMVVKWVMGEATSTSLDLDAKTRLEHLMTGHREVIPKIVNAVLSDDEMGLGQGHERGLNLVQNRFADDITSFLQDATDGLISRGNRIIHLRTRSKVLPKDCSNVSSHAFNCILRQREVWGVNRNLRGIRSFKDQIMNAIEDKFVREAEWTDCSGDIATICWIPGDGFFCGATCHSDEHNMQYNKPGNLLVGSVSGRALHSISGHQVVRPIVTKGENSRASMRGTQDPWMYCSVTSTAYSHDNQKCFTGSYDQTVKVWNVAEDRSSMELCGTWEHAGNVNFVVASPHHGMIATAADVSENAVRVYDFDPDDISASPFETYEQSCPRRSGSDTWAYFPATMQWGKAASVSHLLLVGYSPRSFNCLDADIPEDKANTGELCLWDARQKTQISIATARTQNVFEVIWHPTQPMFVSATSPSGERGDHTKTQLRIFGQTETGLFSHMKTLDCPAADINEITIMPNSLVECYITASCTDGNTYVWDSAQGDRPIHVLSHGPPIDDQAHDLSREEFDVGVKFAAWGKTNDRFYTGSSDGVVKAWNVRSPVGEEFVRDVVTLSGGVSTGAFSPDFAKLVIGDSTGKVHLLSIQEDVGDQGRPIIRQPVTPHAPLPPPLVDEDDMEIEPEQTARERAHEFLERGQIVLHEDRYVGAIQGPNYAATGFFCPEGHKDGDIDKRVISDWRALKKSRYRYKKIGFPILPECRSSHRLLHEKNIAKDLDTSVLAPETLAQLRKDGVDLQFQDENIFTFELGLRLGEEKPSVKQEDSSNDSETDRQLDEDSSLSESEIYECQQLRRDISRELRLRKSLDLVLRELELDVVS